MSLTYFKHYQMELDLQFFDIPSPELSGLSFRAMVRGRPREHADIKYQSFCNEIDANVFSCFRELEGCQLVREITSRSNLPDATWLLVYDCPQVKHQPPWGPFRHG